MSPSSTLPAPRRGLRVVPDPNVLVSAIVTPGGVCAELLVRLVRSPVALVLSPLVLAEVDTLLQRPRFRRIGASQRIAYIAFLERVGEMSRDPAAAGGVLVARDTDDDYLVRLTLAESDCILVSGDPHLLDPAGVYPIVSPRTLLDRLIAAEGR